MSVACISDIHVTDPSGDSYKLLMRFMNHERALACQDVVFLGDVFDHLTGEHKEYLEKYREFFERTASLLNAGKNVYFVEGNHDFHFEKTFRLGLEANLSPERLSSFFYVRKGVELKVGAKRIYFCHGDQLDLDNKAYARWKKIYSSKLFGFIISNFLPYSAVEAIGERASSDSKRRGKAVFDYESARDKYRAAAKTLLQDSPFDGLVAGHTHIQDELSWDGKFYVNIGFPPRDKNFLVLSESEVIRPSLV